MQSIFSKAQPACSLLVGHAFSVGNRGTVHLRLVPIHLQVVVEDDIEDWNDRLKRTWRLFRPSEEEGKQLISSKELPQ